MRLIDADELIEIAHRIRLDSRERIERMIESAPTVDAVEVIRCKDCVYYKAGGCRAKETIVIESEFCSWGERKDEAD